MINIVDTFNQLITKWNTENKCGLCWEFEAPMREGDLNESTQKQNDCCVRCFITDYSFRKDHTRSRSTTIQSTTITHSATLHFLIKDDIGLNVYGEQAGHPISESKWETILKKLAFCINLTDMCDYLGYDLQITGENWTQVIDAYDDNYTGWSVNLTIKETIL